jgi:hypothetical protein
MKYVVSWTTRSTGSARDNEEAVKRSLAVFAKWSPSTTIHQFLSRVDANGGFAVGETDDLAQLARDFAIFSPYLEFTVYPVVDIEQGARILGEAAGFRDSVG